MPSSVTTSLFSIQLKIAPRFLRTFKKPGAQYTNSFGHYAIYLPPFNGKKEKKTGNGTYRQTASEEQVQRARKQPWLGARASNYNLTTGERSARARVSSAERMARARIRRLQVLDCLSAPLAATSCSTSARARAAVPPAPPSNQPLLFPSPRARE